MLIKLTVTNVSDTKWLKELSYLFISSISINTQIAHSFILFFSIETLTITDINY
jgi:hypothetical protein